MVGLSVVLESHKAKKTTLPLFIINKATMMPNKPPPPAVSGHRLPPPPVAEDFLNACLLCRQKLLPGKDIYMYKGDRAFCSEECRWKQMQMEEEEHTSNSNNQLARRKERAPNNNCSLAAMKPVSTVAASSTARPHTHRRATRVPPPSGGFAR